MSEGDSESLQGQRTGYIRAMRKDDVEIVQLQSLEGLFHTLYYAVNSM